MSEEYVASKWYQRLWCYVINRFFQITKYQCGYALAYRKDDEGKNEDTLAIYVRGTAVLGIPFEVCLDDEAILDMASWVKNKKEMIKKLKCEEEGYAA